MKIVSDVSAAQDAVSGFGEVDLSAVGQQLSLGSSNVSSMQDGVTVANKLWSRIGELLSEVKGQAAHVSALALEIENRDKQDTYAWCEAR